MVSYTLIYRTVRCPLWNDDVRLSAKYRYSDDPNTPYLARFVCAECEIVRNLRLPEYQQDKRLGLYRFCDRHPCQLLQDFPNEIDVRNP